MYSNCLLFAFTHAFISLLKESIVVWLSASYSSLISTSLINLLEKIINPIRMSYLFPSEDSSLHLISYMFIYSNDLWLGPRYWMALSNQRISTHSELINDFFLWRQFWTDDGVWLVRWSWSSRSCTFMGYPFCGFDLMMNAMYDIIQKHSNQTPSSNLKC